MFLFINNLLKTILAIFFDFAKAFDLVTHDILMEKLEKLLSTWLTNLIATYLSNLKQRVRMNNIETEWQKVETGIIQGSSPIL
jgi:hypothetical protein